MNQGVGVERPFVPMQSPALEWLDKFRGFSWIISIELALAANVVVMPFAYFVLEWSGKQLTTLAVVCFTAPFVLMIGEKVTQLRAHRAAAVTTMQREHLQQRSFAVQIAEVEARLEALVGRDLNKSGEVGDVAVAEAGPPPPVVHHFVNTNRVVPEHYFDVEGGQVLREHLIEFVRGISARGIKRRDWLGEDGGAAAFVFGDGAAITREEYDIIIRILEEKSRSIHGNGVARRVVHSPEQILAVLGI